MDLPPPPSTHATIIAIRRRLPEIALVTRAPSLEAGGGLEQRVERSERAPPHRAFTRDVAGAIALLEAFKKGDNIIDPENKKTITMVPITSATDEKTITFPNAYLQPGLSYTPGADDEPSVVQLVYICKPDATTGKPFVYGDAA